MYTPLLLFLLPAAHAQLDSLAKSAGLKYFGTATDNNELTDSAYQAVLAGGDFGQITPANSQKWDAIEPSNGTFTFTNGDAITALAKQNSQLIRCHNTVWYSQLPAWVSGGTWTNETLLEVMKDHITTEMTHYKGQCYAWDVVNEAFNDNGTLRADVFYNIIGPDYIRIAFETAAAVDPDVKLYYNDYNIEYAGPKATAALELVKSLKASGTKIDGVGFQSHFIVGETPTLEDQVSNLESFTALGVEVALTELDIRMTLPSTDDLVTQQNIDYANSVGACVATKGCVGVTVWDFDDKYSWIPQTFSGQGSACLWDENLNKKPAYYAVAAALGGSNSTSNSTAKFRPRSSTQLARLYKEY